jgi:hypothetical protein
MGKAHRVDPARSELKENAAKERQGNNRTDTNHGEGLLPPDSKEATWALLLARIKANENKIE